MLSPSLTAILTDADLTIDPAPSDTSFQLHHSPIVHQTDPSRTLGSERRSITFQFEFGTKPAYIIVSLYDDNVPAELLIHLPHATPEVSDLAQAISGLVTTMLQTHIGLGDIIQTMQQSNHDIPRAVAAFLHSRFATQVNPHLDSLSQLPVIELADKEVKE